jgi:hypothetical protein
MRAFQLTSLAWFRAPLTLAALGALVFAAACRDDRPAPEPPVPAVEAAPSAPSGLESPPQAALPPTGQSRVRIHAGEVTLLANDVPRLRLLLELAGEAGFEVAMGAVGQPSGSVTLLMVKLPLERALARLLVGVPYALHYAADTEGEEATLARVALGESGMGEEIAERREPRREPHPSRDEPATARLERARAPADRARFDRQQAEAIRGLEDRSPEGRIDAANSIYPDSQGIDALAGVVTDDPEPAVRMAAAENLGYIAEDPKAVGALLRALHDPEPEVVITALDALEFAGDHTVIPELGFLLEHPDPDVRDATADAIWWLEE